MDLGISGKHALVGGGSKGLGLASALALAAEKCMVTLVSRSMDHLADALSKFPPGAQVHLVEADLSSAGGRRIALEAATQNGPVDILVNNTGGPAPGGTFAHGSAAWEKACDQLLYYVKEMCEALVPGMKKRGWGRIITITSITVKEPSPQLALSNVYRAAVTAYLKGLSLEAAVHGITVNQVMPSAFRTERYEQILDVLAAGAGKDREAVAGEIAARSPQGRFQRPEELGSLVAFLASEKASAINGASIAVDGGTLKSLF